MDISKPKVKIWISIIISVVSIFLAVILAFTPLFQNLELKMLDFMFSTRGSVELQDSEVVIIGIDDQSDESTPHRWPWPRSYFAHVIENLQEAGAAIVAIDVIFDQPDKYGPEQDDELTRVLNTYDNIVLTGKLLRTSQYYTYETLIPPYDKFITPNTRWGLAAIEADIDGFYRRYQVGSVYNDSLLPSFAAQVLSISQGLELSDSMRQDEEFFYLGEYQIPKFDSYSMLINYNGPAYTFQYYPFDNILDDEDFDLMDDFDMDVFDDPGDPEFDIPPGLKYSGQLKDKIVLIGSTIQELHDNFPTPFLEFRNSDGMNVRAEMPGVEIHANAITTILNNNYITEVSRLVGLIILILFAFVVYFITRHLPTTWGSMLMVGMLLLYIVLGFVSFVYLNKIVNFSAPILVIFLTFAGHTLYHYLLTQQEKKMLRGAFAHYVPEKVVQEIMNNPSTLSLGGEERVVSVMFSDIAGFTSISEELKPRELVALLNEYLTRMTEIIIQHNGIIDKYEGDAIMAEFGVPVHYEDHAIMACRAALEMQKALKEMRKKWQEEGKPALHARIGINTGEVIVGNMGSANVFDYTVMGDHVNLGARLESANKFYGTRIMISEYTLEQVTDDFYTRPLDLIRVKGKTKPIEVFELLADRESKFTSKYREMLEVYNRGIQAYRSQEWDRAIELFDHCSVLYPQEKAAQVYRQRCLEFQLTPPPADWDGVTTMSEK